MVYAIVNSAHAPVADAATAATALLRLDPEAGRVRLRANAEDTVALSVDLSRFHDCAALALASAIAFSTPRRRGRPRRRLPSGEAAVPYPGSPRTSPEHAPRLSAAQERLFAALAGCCASNPIIIEQPGPAPTAHHDDRRLQLLVDSAAGTAVRLAETLTTLGARPRAVPTRPGFTIAPSCFSTLDRVALAIGDIALDIAISWPGAGRYDDAVSHAVPWQVAGRSIRAVTVPARRPPATQ